MTKDKNGFQLETNKTMDIQKKVHLLQQNHERPSYPAETSTPFRSPMDNRQVLISSTLSGFLVSGISTPFDVVKNYWIYTPSFQTNRTAVEIREIFKSLYQKGGVRIFYTGFGATCATLVPANLIFFYFYEKLRYSNQHPAVAGIGARLMAVLLTAPCEFFRTSQQANAGVVTNGLWQRPDRFLILLRNCRYGFMATMLRDVPFSAVYWTLNEKGKLWLSNYYGRKNSQLFNAFAYSFLAGAFSASIATALTHPLDVIKTNIQGLLHPLGANTTINVSKKPTSLRTMDVGLKIWRSSGPKGFLVGLSPRLAKVVPCCALLIASYDFSKALVPTPES